MTRRITLLLLLICATTLFAQSNYQMAGPYEVVARDGQYRSSKMGSERDMWAAWQCARQGNTDKATEIINAYAKKLQRFDGHDAPLCTIQAYWLLRAMMLERDNQTAEWSAMVRRAILPTIDRFESASPYANGNWGAIVNRCRMAAAIFLQDSVLYQASVEYFLHANDNGSLPRYVAPSGQCQETGRDQGHAQLGLGALCETCEMAWQQGTDLWGALDNRLMKGMEYTARYNLGYDVPFEQWTDCTGLYNDWKEPGSMGRGRIRCIYDLPYSHYVGRLGLKMPYTKRVLNLQRKAERSGELKHNPEADQFTVKGVKEGHKLHQVFTYAAPGGAPLKHDYDVYVQPRGQKEWTRIDTYMARVNALQADGSHKVSEISYGVFDFTGDVFVRVIPRNHKIRIARVRPDYRGVIANVQNDSTLQFLLFQPENVSVEFQYEGDADFDTAHNLLLFTSKPALSKEAAEREAKKLDRRFIYFPAGYYSAETAAAPLPMKKNEWGDAAMQVPSNTTVYIEGGSYINGTFEINGAQDVTILGRGIARPSRGYLGSSVYHSQNVLIDGLVVNTCPIGESRDVTLHDVRSISHPSWGDGLNVFGGCENILFDRVFCRNSDDCTTAYATRKGYKGSVRNVRMRNSTLWADVAHSIMIGLHGNATDEDGKPTGIPAERGDTIENLTYENIDILCQAEPQVDYQGCLAINCGDNNLVRNIIFDNIRIEQITQGSILQVKVTHNDKYCCAPGRAIEDITFRTIRSLTPNPSPLGKGSGYSIITGYDGDRKVKNIRFEDFRINGQRIYDDMPGKPRWYHTSDYVPMYVGPHVEKLTFTK